MLWLVQIDKELTFIKPFSAREALGQSWLKDLGEFTACGIELDLTIFW